MTLDQIYAHLRGASFNQSWTSQEQVVDLSRALEAARDAFAAGQAERDQLLAENVKLKADVSRMVLEADRLLEQLIRERDETDRLRDALRRFTP